MFFSEKHIFIQDHVSSAVRATDTNNTQATGISGICQ